MSWWLGYGLTRAVGGLISRETQSSPRTDSYLLPDEQARQAVCAKLEADPELQASGLTVSVLSGALTVSGRVASQELRARAEQLCRETAGVSSVTNQLEV